MNSKILAASIISVSALGASYAQATPETNSTETVTVAVTQPIELESRRYHCEIIEYKSKDSKETVKAAEPFVVGMYDSAERVKPVITGESKNRIEWKVSRQSGKVMVETKNTEGFIQITTAVEPSSIGVEIPSTRNILACNQKGIGSAKLNIDPTVYGESESRTIRPITPTDLEIQQLMRNPQLMKQLDRLKLEDDYRKY